MLTPERWQAEVIHMRHVCPQVRSFARGTIVGFAVVLIGPQTGIRYHVIVQAEVKDYPQKEPAVFMHPRAEHHHWIDDGRLCYQRKWHTWDPARDTFTQCLSIAVKYLVEFDGR